MHHKKNGFLKSSSTFIKRIFRARNIIIISDHKVDHVPLSGALQVLLLVGMCVLFSGVSYITGSYMTARSTIREKDRAIVSTSLARNRIGVEMDTLKDDIVKLRKNGKELNSYSKSIIDQHLAEASLANADANASLLFAPQNLFGQNAERLSARVSYLENRIQSITDENDRLVTAIRDRTDKKITLFQDIIAMTGLDSDRLEAMALRSAGKKAGALSQSAPYYPPVQDISKKDVHAHGENQGGPFIPYNEAALNDTDQQLVSNVDRLVLLHDIVQQLPLERPISGAQITGPFGKRVDPINGRWAIHPGLDLAGPTGSKIFAANNGVVVSAGHKIAYGNMVDIDHGFGIVTRYAHMSRIVVREGQVVKKGQQIGVQGSTGRSTGAHLHYEVRINDRPVNPITFLHAGEYVSQNQ